MNRTEKSIKNLRYGMMYQLMDILLKFILRTVMVQKLGDATVGLNGLFTEVLAMLSLAEMGVGSAIIYSLYKPLSEGDDKKVASLMMLFKRAYEIIALGIFLIGLVLLPFIQYLVTKVDFDINYIRLVYFMFLCSTASSYLFSYKSALLSADQRAYKSTRIAMMVSVAVIACKLAVLLIWGNFIIFLAVDILGKVIQNVWVSHAADRDYPFLKEKSDLPDKKERSVIFRDIKHLFIGRLSGKITNSTDNTLISVMDSTLSVGFYSNYAMVFNSARNLVTQFSSATSGSIGNLMTVDSPERCYAMLKRLTMLMFFPGSIICSCFYGQLSPLVSVWLGPQRVLSDMIVSVLVLNFMFYVIREPLWQFVGVSGLFKKDKNISLIGTTANLIISILLGVKLGMLGIFIGTTATLLIQYFLKTELLCRERFHLSSVSFHLLTLAFFAVTAASAVLCKWLCGMIVIENGWLGLIVNCTVTCIITFAIDVLAFHFTSEMRYCRMLLVQRVKKLLKKV